MSSLPQDKGVRQGSMGMRWLLVGGRLLRARKRSSDRIAMAFIISITTIDRANSLSVSWFPAVFFEGVCCIGIDAFLDSGEKERIP